MTDNRAIFETVRPWTVPPGFNDARNRAALDDACARFLVSRDREDIYRAVRPLIDEHKFNVRGRSEALDAACDRFLAANAPAGIAEGVRGAAEAIAGGGGAGGLVAANEGDDRYLRLFQHLASPQANPETVKAMARSFAAHAPAYGQDQSKARIADFVAQISNETGGFTRFEENLHYSARRLMQVWPRRFPTLASAQPYAWDPSDPDREDVALANYTYGKRMGNERDGTDDNDGWDYRGRGALQLTGHEAYRQAGERLNLPLVDHPDLAADPGVSVQIALDFYRENRVNAAIDRGDTDRAREITNGGHVGLDEVNRRRRLALEVL